MFPDKLALVCDDDALSLVSSTNLLQANGYPCHSASSCEQAVKMLSENRYDLLILDTHLPGREGFALLRRVPLLAGNTPIIVTTCFPTLETAIESLHMSVIAYLVKPLDSGQLIDWVEVALHQGSTRRKLEDCRQQLGQWKSNLEHIDGLLRVATGLPKAELSLAEPSAHVCMPVPQQPDPPAKVAVAAPALVEGLAQAVEVLEKTKRSFKSKDLAQLRHRLTGLLAQ